MADRDNKKRQRPQEEVKQENSLHKENDAKRIKTHHPHGVPQQDFLRQIFKNETTHERSRSPSPCGSVITNSPMREDQFPTTVPFTENYSGLFNNATRLIHHLEHTIMNHPNLGDLSKKVSQVLLNAKKELGYALHTEIILAGKVGVGKSTIVNSLLGYDIAPSSAAARSLTRAIVKYKYWENSTFLVKVFRSKTVSSTKSTEVQESVEAKVINSAHLVIQFLHKMFAESDSMLKTEEQEAAEGSKLEQVEQNVEEDPVQTLERIECVEVYSNARILQSGLISLVDAPGYSYAEKSKKFIDATYRSNSVNNVEYWVVFDSSRAEEDPTLWEFIKHVYNGIEVLQTNSLCLVWHRFYEPLGELMEEASKEDPDVEVSQEDLIKKAKVMKINESNKFLKGSQRGVNIQLSVEDIRCSYYIHDRVKKTKTIYMNELEQRVKLLEQRALSIFSNLVDSLIRLVQTNEENRVITNLKEQIERIGIMSEEETRVLSSAFNEAVSQLQHKLSFENDQILLRQAIVYGGTYANVKKRLDLRSEIAKALGDVAQKAIDGKLKNIINCINAAENNHLFKSTLINVINTRTRTIADGIKQDVVTALPSILIMACENDAQGKRISKGPGYCMRTFKNFIEFVKAQQISTTVFERLVTTFLEMVSELCSQLKSFNNNLNVQALVNIPEFNNFTALLQTLKSEIVIYTPKALPQGTRKLEWNNGGRGLAEALLFSMPESKRQSSYKEIVEYCQERVRHFKNQNRVHTDGQVVDSSKLLCNAHLFESILMFDCYIFPTNYTLFHLCKRMDLKLEIFGNLLGDGHTHRLFGDKSATHTIKLLYDANSCRFYPTATSQEAQSKLPNPNEYSLAISYQK